MRKKLLFPVLAVLMLIPWPVAYAYDNDPGGQEPYTIEAADNGDTPTWEAYGNAIGGVNQPVDLFFIDVTGNPADIAASLYITNAAELTHYYRYLILRIGLYVQDDAGQWEEYTAIPYTYITMNNGRVDFDLPGYGKYKVTIDSGSFNSHTASGGGNACPEFYLTAR
ncbi:hypothetical protein ACFLV2_02465 [Chloroflexota bacterium]